MAVTSVPTTSIETASESLARKEGGGAAIMEFQGKQRW